MVCVFVQLNQILGLMDVVYDRIWLEFVWLFTLFLEFVSYGCYGLVCLSQIEYGIPGCYGIAFGLYVVSDSQLNHRDFG